MMLPSLRVGVSLSTRDGGGVLRVVVIDGTSVDWVTCFLVLVWLLVPVLRWQ